MLHVIIFLTYNLFIVLSGIEARRRANVMAKGCFASTVIIMVLLVLAATTLCIAALWI